MRHHHATAVLVLAGFLIAAWLTGGAARADTCPPLKLLDQIPMLPVNDGTTVLVPVSINGADKFMLFDTGGSASSVTRALANALGLVVYPTPRRGVLYDAYGDVSRDATTVRDFRLGHRDISSVIFKIWPDPNLENADPRLAGVLSLDQLLAYDIDADFPGHVLKLFSPDHCDGKILYWKADAVAMIPFDARNGHINIMTELDGKDVSAIIDTGATHSILSAGAASRFFGLAPETSIAQQAGPSARKEQYRAYKFSELDFGDVAVKNPMIVIWPDTMDRYIDRSLQNTGNRAIPLSYGVKPPQLIIGMDILSKLHMYIASREHRVYFSSAAPADAKSQ